MSLSSLDRSTEGPGGPPPPGAALDELDFDVLHLDPRHTGVNHLSEVALLQHTGALQWRAIARRCGLRMRQLRAPGDREVYASFYYARLHFPLDRPISHHRIDDRLGFDTSIRLFGDTLVDGWHRLWPEPEIPRRSAAVSAGRSGPATWSPPAPGDGAWIRLSNVFVAKKQGAAQLEVCSPTNLDPRRFRRAGQRFDSYHKIKQVRGDGAFPADRVRTAAPLGEVQLRLPINPDRDINGVGLVYFAKYLTFLDSAERKLLTDRADGLAATMLRRSLVEREIAYYANAQADDVVAVRTRGHRLQSLPGDPPGTALLRFDHVAHRCSDGRLLCISAAVKQVPS